MIFSTTPKRSGITCRTIILIVSGVMLLMSSMSADVWDTAKFKVNHDPKAVDTTLAFDRPVPHGQAKELKGQASPGTKVKEIKTTEAIADANFNTPNNGKTSATIVINNTLATGAYPATFKGTYVPDVTGGQAGALPDWSGQSDVTVVAGDLIIDAVVREENLPNSVPTGATRQVTVTFGSSWPQGGSATFEIINQDSDNGTATIEGTTTLSGNAGEEKTLMIKGGTMTEPDHSGQLKIVGKVNQQQVGESPGFSVCAHPTSVAMINPAWYVGFHGDFNTLVALLEVEPKFTSDRVPAGNPNEALAKCWVPEVLGPIYERTGSFAEGDIQLIAGQEKRPADWFVDNHGAPQAVWANFGAPGTFKHQQLYLFWCERCGMTQGAAVPIKNSGFRLDFNRLTNQTARITKTPAKVSIGDESAEAGAGQSRIAQGATQ